VTLRVLAVPGGEGVTGVVLPALRRLSLAAVVPQLPNAYEMGLLEAQAAAVAPALRRPFELQPRLHFRAPRLARLRLERADNDLAPWLRAQSRLTELEARWAPPPPPAAGRPPPPSRPPQSAPGV
jgi:hypothetical protein